MIHDTAIIDKGAIIHPENNDIWAFSHVMAGAKVYPGCTIGQGVVIGRDVEVGSGCKIQDHALIFKGVILMRDVFIGPSVTFTNVINPRAFIPRKNEFKTTLVKTGASIGANSTIVCGVTIGKYAMIGAGSVVTKDVPDYALVVGNPAKKIGEVNEAGYRTNCKTD